MADARSNPVSVAVVIPCYRQAHYLPAAIESVLAQTHPQFEIVVIDDGSPDDTGAVAARYPGVRCVRQTNRGLAGARNAGIRESRSEFLVFLDADDRLLPNALADGLACFAAHPDSAFVSGGFRYIDAGGRPASAADVPQFLSDHYAEMLRRSYITMHATVMFRRDVLEAVGGFDTSLHVCEDFDLYLRIARRHPVRCHGAVVAEYRRHAANVSRNYPLMLEGALRVLRSQRPYVESDPVLRQAYDTGEHFWTNYYGGELVAEIGTLTGRRRFVEAARLYRTLLQLAPGFALGRKGMPLTIRRVAGGTARALLPAAVVYRLRRLFGRHAQMYIPPGQVALGDFGRLHPVSRQFGLDRGLPVDRYYIEGFLERHTDDVKGRVLEIADNAYTLRFGGSRVTVSDVMHVHAGPGVTIVGDLTDAPHIPAGTFDCIILTQTLHLIYDFHAALRTLYRILRPGGTLLLTSPGITKAGEGIPDGVAWHWSFTRESVTRMLGDVFTPEAVQVEDHGNVFAAVVFLHGLALQEVSTAALEHRDAAFPVIIAARAVKPVLSS